MLREQTLLTKVIWGLLLIAAIDALWNWQLSLVFIALSTLALSMAPTLVARWAEIHVPASFMLAVVAFVGGTLFLGEVYGFYERFWWWDVVMHGGSALGFGLIGFVFVFMLFQGDRFAAPHGALAFLAFCFALAIGALWEIFEYGMDSLLGTNMQKSGLVDTMNDLMVDVAGAAFGALSGWAYLKGRSAVGLQRLIGEFVERNPRYFRHINRVQPRPTEKQTRRNGAD
jgi:hypothetical protein